MKRFNLIILAFCLILVGCTSQEEKVAKLIDEHMYKVLYDYESYEPIEFQIDSAFASIHYDKEAIRIAKKGCEEMSEMSDLLDQVKTAQEYMNLWDDSYSSYGFSQWKKYREEALELLDKFNEKKKKLDDDIVKIKAINLNIGDEFIGWRVIHRYRVNNRGGNKSIGDDLFIVSSEYDKVLFTRDLNDDDEDKVHSFIDEAIVYSESD